MNVKAIVGNVIKWTRAHGPMIGMVSGTAANAVGTVALCRATPKLDDILKAQEGKLKALEEKLAGGMEAGEHRKALRKIRLETLWELTKIFGPGIALWGGGMGLMWASSITLQKRNAAALAALSAVSAQFEAYRTRVREKYGITEDYILATGQQNKIETHEVEGKKGKKDTVTEQIPDKDTVTVGAYQRIFDSSNPYWCDYDLDRNLVFLKSAQNTMNDRVYSKVNPTTVLNEVLEYTGFAGTKIGSRAGWTIKNDGKRDCRIDFGIFDPATGLPYDHVLDTLHKSRYILLDFNVDGFVLDDYKE